MRKAPGLTEADSKRYTSKAPSAFQHSQRFFVATVLIVAAIVNATSAEQPSSAKTIEGYYHIGYGSSPRREEGAISELRALHGVVEPVRICTSQPSSSSQRVRLACGRWRYFTPGFLRVRTAPRRTIWRNTSSSTETSRRRRLEGRNIESCRIRQRIYVGWRQQARLPVSTSAIPQGYCTASRRQKMMSRQS